MRVLIWSGAGIYAPTYETEYSGWVWELTLGNPVVGVRLTSIEQAYKITDSVSVEL